MKISTISIALAGSLLAGPAFADTVSFREGIAGYTGTFTIAIGSGGPDGTFTAEELSVDQDTGDYGLDGVGQVLMRFDDIFGPGGIPAGATILGASLRTETGSSTDGPVSLYRMLVDWGSSSSWNSLGNGVQPGVETAAAEASFADIENPSTLLWDVTASVQAWAAGASNFGWLFNNASGDGWDVVTELAFADLRPQLTVEFAPAPVPVPAAVWMLASGLGALGFARRRR